MAWTTRIIHIDKDTAEVLDKKLIYNKTWEIIDKEIIYQKINETHTERIIIYNCRAARQQQLFQ